MSNPPAVEPKPAQPAENEKIADDPAKRAVYSRAVADARRAIWRRDMATARKFVKTAQANLQNQADQTEFERLEIILDNLNQFWNGLRNAVAKLQAGDELELKDNRVAVIEANRNELMIQIYGRQERYRVEAMPIALMTALVNQSFAQTPDSKVIVATFLAMDKEGDRGRARLLWEDAAKHGQSLGRDLLPELSIPLPDVGGGSGARFIIWAMAAEGFGPPVGNARHKCRRYASRGTSIALEQGAGLRNMPQSRDFC